MAGLSDTQERSILDNAFNQTLYLRLLTGAAGQTVNDDGTFPGGCAELSGYTPRQVLQAEWEAAVAGAPSYKAVPKSSAGAVWSFTNSTGLAWTICGYCWTSTNATIGAANLVSGGVFVDTNDTPIVYTVANTAVFNKITSATPIIERLGDAPAGVDPT